MKKTKFNFLLIALSILLTFTSCNDDNLHNQEHDAKAGIKSSKITFNEFRNHTKAFNLVADVNKKQSESNSALNRIIKDTLNNFTIDTQEGLYLQYANLHSFTFPIHREEDNGKLENLVLSYQNDGSYKVKILKYDLTPQEKADLELDQLKNIQNPIITIPIENFNTNLVVNGCETITETIWVSCGHGVHNSSNVNSWPSCTSDTPPRVYTVSKIKCIDSGGSTGGGGNPIDGGFGPGSTPGGGGGGPADNSFPPEYPTPETEIQDYEEGISAPILNNGNSLDIRNAGIFYRSLSFQQQQWVAENLNSYNQLIQYQIDNNWSDESEVFAEELINLAIENNATFNFDNTIDPSNSLNFNNVQEFKEYYENYNNSIASNFEITNDPIQSSVKTARCTFMASSIPPYYINVQVRQKLGTTSTPYEILGVSSNQSGATLATEWHQNDDFEVSYSGNITTITFTGSISLNCFIDGIGIFYTDQVTIVIKLNKNTGAFISGNLYGID